MYREETSNMPERVLCLVQNLLKKEPDSNPPVFFGNWKSDNPEGLIQYDSVRVYYTLVVARPLVNFF